MTTARDFIQLALKEAGVLGVGQTALAEDINDGLTLFQRMMAQWQKKRWLTPALIDISMIGNNQRSNTIGTGGYWNVPRPVDISGGYVIQLNTGSTPVSLPLTKIPSYEDYIRISVKNLNTLPDHFFYDGAFPLGNIFVWPIPSATYEVHLLVPIQLGYPLDLNSVFVMPEEYEEAIHYNLAKRYCSMYNKPASRDLIILAKSSLHTVKTANIQIPTLQMPRPLKTGRAFNLFNADGY